MNAEQEDDAIELHNDEQFEDAEMMGDDEEVGPPRPQQRRPWANEQRARQDPVLGRRRHRPAYWDEGDADDEQEGGPAAAQQQTNQFFIKLLETINKPAPKLKKYNEAPKYDGEADYSVYQVQFNTIAEANEWDERDRKTALVQALTGNAMDVIANLQHQEVPITYENLDQALVKTFSKTASMWERKKDFNTLSQEKDQSIRQFARQVERLGRSYLRNMKESDIQEALVERFLKGLLDKRAAAKLAFASLPNLDEAMKALNRGLSLEIDEPPAKRVRLTKTEDTEGEEEAKTSNNEVKVNMVFPSQPSTSTDATVQTGRGRGRGSRGPRGGRGSRGGRGYSRGGYSAGPNPDKDMTCRVCGKQGHRAANCWHNKGPGQARSGELTCHNCGKKGHFARECRSKSNSGFAMPNVPPDLYKATMQWFLSQQGNDNSSHKIPFVPKPDQKSEN